VTFVFQYATNNNPLGAYYVLCNPVQTIYSKHYYWHWYLKVMYWRLYMYFSSMYWYYKVNSALHPSEVAYSSTSFGWGKGGNVTSAG